MIFVFVYFLKKCVLITVEKDLKKHFANIVAIKHSMKSFSGEVT